MRVADLLSAPLLTGFAAGKNDQALQGVDSIPQLRPTNISADGEIDFAEAKAIPAEVVSSNDVLQRGEVLFNNTNSSAWVGKSALFDSDRTAVCSNHVTRLRVSADVSPRLVMESLNALQRLGYFRWTATNFNNQAGINNDTLAEIVIPLGNPSQRDALLADLNTARAARDAGLRDADALLAGIDAFVLDALGLTLPPPHNPTRPFAVRLGEIASNRVDADYYTPRFKALRAQVEASSFAVRTLGELCFPLLSGFAAGADAQGDAADGIPHIRPTNISGSGELEEAGMKYVPEAAVGPRDLLARGEVLFNNTNSSTWVGKSAVFDWDRPCACSNHVTRLRLTDRRHSPAYLAAVLNALRKLGYFAVLATNFNNQSGINSETLSALRLPVPDAQEQATIATEVNRRRAEARRLRHDARQGWNAARTRFEEALLAPAA